MKVVGTGCGPGMLTAQAIEAIRKARLIYGSGRAIALAAPYITSGCDVRPIGGYRDLRTLPEEAVVLSTGDPMLAGLGPFGGEVIPGISSMQLAFARLRIPLTRGVAVNAHGRDHAGAVAQVIDELGRGKIVFLLTDPGFSITALADALRAAGIEAAIAVCEALGYPDERIATGSVGHPPAHRQDLFVLVLGDFAEPPR
jgi:cobalt-precorrin-7 (C5)-methyltransferase